MATNRVVLICLSALILVASISISLAQNTSNPMLSGNTVNPVMSGNTVANGRENPVSPALNTGALNPATGTNPFTGMPCSGPPTSGGTTTSVTGAGFPSVYGPPPSQC